MTSIPIEKIVDLDIDSFAAVQGRNGPQWKVTCSVPWSKPEYKQSFWFDRVEGSAPPEPGRYRCRLGRSGEPFTKKDGTSGDGSRAYHYNWYLNDFGLDASVSVRDVPSPTPAQAWQAPDLSENAKREAAQPAPMPSNGAPYADPRQNSIEKQVVFKAAVDLTVAQGSWTHAEPPVVAEFVQGLAAELWPVLQGIGSTAPEPPAPPETNENGLGWPTESPPSPTYTAKADFSDCLQKYKWSKEWVTSVLRMDIAEWLKMDPAPGNDFEQNARWRSALDNCMEAHEKNVTLAENAADNADAEEGAAHPSEPDDDPLPW